MFTAGRSIDGHATACYCMRILISVTYRLQSGSAAAAAAAAFPAIVRQQYCAAVRVASNAGVRPINNWTGGVSYTP